MKLVTNEDVPWASVQGEGVYTGTPSAFVRLHGCDFSCSFCDSKKSWQEGSLWRDESVETVLDKMRSFRLPHAVITGGNPCLQEQEVSELLAGLRAEWVDSEQGDAWRPGMFTTVETQASIYVESIAMLADFMSLSPKLHDWRDEPLLDYVTYAVTRPGKGAQIKVVCWDEASTNVALTRMELVYRHARRIAKAHDTRRNLHFIVQPEWSTGRDGAHAVRKALESWHTKTLSGFDYPLVRFMVQAHKTPLLQVR